MSKLSSVILEGLNSTLVLDGGTLNYGNIQINSAPTTLNIINGGTLKLGGNDDMNGRWIEDFNLNIIDGTIENIE